MSMRPNFYTSDQEAMKAAYSGALRAAGEKSPMLVGAIAFILNYIIGVLAFTAKPFLRRKMGERSFGIITLLLAFWIYHVYDCTFYFVKNRTKETLTEVQSKKIQNREIGPQDFFKTIVDDLTYTQFSLFRGLLSYNEPPYQDSNKGFVLFVLKFVFLLFGMISLVGVNMRRLRNIRMHSFYRGKSNLWGWLIGRKVFGKGIQDYHIHMILDPLTLLVLSYILYNYSNSQLSYLGFLPIMGALGIFLEEYFFYNRRRSILLDMVDAEIESAYLLGRKANFQSDEKDGNSIRDISLQEKGRVSLP